MEYHFSIKDVMALSHTGSSVMNELLKNKAHLLPKRILTYALAQQIMIQIASDKNQSHLRGIGSRLEDYTLNQLLQFILAQNLDIDTKDYRYRLWTVILSNSYQLQIEYEDVQRAMQEEHQSEYLYEILRTLTQFVDDAHDLDGQSLVVAKESFIRFSTPADLLEIAHRYQISVPERMSQEDFAELIADKLDDHTDELKNAMMEMSYDELEHFARENYIKDNGELTTKELTEHFLSNYEASDVTTTKIEYKDFLEIPSLTQDSYVEEPEEASFEVPEELSVQLTSAIDSLLKDPVEELSDEEAAEQLHQILHVNSNQEMVLLQHRIEQLEHKLDDTNTLLMNQLMERMDLESKKKSTKKKPKKQINSKHSATSLNKEKKVVQEKKEVKTKEAKPLFGPKFKRAFWIWLVITILLASLLLLNHYL